MKKVEAFIRPQKIEEIKEVLKDLNLNGMSISQIMGCGNQKGWTEYFRGAEVDVNFLPKVKVEVVVQDDQVENVVSKIIEASRTGEIGDGKIFISDIIDAVRIRTGERGVDALK
jgi:nitrogen regulatory protein P-II 1